jgi:hypothetical protein
MSQPAVIVTGDVSYGESELAYRLACMLAATLPQNVLLFGLNREAATSLIAALVAAFGPPAGRVSDSSVVVLAGELWRSLPARVQRRMHEVFAHPQTVSYEDLWARSVQSTRRVGLYVVGDLEIALNSVLEDPEVTNSVDINAPDRCLKLCQVSSSAADLVRLATGADFAEVRWRDDGFERRHSQWNRPAGIPS